MDYTIKHHFQADTSMGKRSTLTIMGLVDEDPFKEVCEPGECEPDKPDYNMILLGASSCLDSRLAILLDIYGVLYDITQITGKIKDGDTFTIAPCIWRTWRKKGTRLPAQHFTMHNFHLVADHKEARNGEKIN